VIYFCLFEMTELFYFAGMAEYFKNFWNLMDVTNYILYFTVYAKLRATYNYRASGMSAWPSSYAADSLGYYDDHLAMGSYRDTKILLSINLCLQLFKLQKFLSMLVPKMGLATAVLRKVYVDLLFFSISFIISMLSFSMMLYVQLGPVMEGYWDQLPAFISLFRALFGDFDIGEILDNSSGYLNTVLFLGYLFIAIFIMLSLFLAILAEGQVAVREDEELRVKLDDDFNEYGVLASGTGIVQRYLRRAAGGLSEHSCGGKKKPRASHQTQTAAQSRFKAHVSLSDVLDAMDSMHGDMQEMRVEAQKREVQTKRHIEVIKSDLHKLIDRRGPLEA